MEIPLLALYLTKTLIVSGQKKLRISQDEERRISFKEWASLHIIYFVIYTGL